MPAFAIGDRIVGTDQPCFVIAEAGCNHEGDLDVACEMVRRAAAGGADAIKFQTYKAEKLATRTAPKYWKDDKPEETQFDTFAALDVFGEPEYRRLADECAAAGIVFMSTPWDLESATYLSDLGMPAFKIGSADITNWPLLEHCAATKKPIILSTGASTIGEVEEAVELVRAAGSDVALLHCILSYPTKPEDAHLRVIKRMRRVFPDVVVGYSDHTLADPGMSICTAAAVLGARIIEKHFTLDKAKAGNDHYLSMDPDDLGVLVSNLRTLEVALGSDAPRRVYETEKAARELARRSLVAARDIKAGEKIERGALTTKRPGTGVSPKLMDVVVGRVAQVDILEDTTIDWSMI